MARLSSIKEPRVIFLADRELGITPIYNLFGIFYNNR
jgi:hypothetical protein